MPNLTGQSIGRYQIIGQLGEGGMATVYKAYDTRLERDVAVKVLRTDQFIPAELHTVLQRFEREAKSLAKLKHANIVNILDFGEHEGKPYLVMEYLPGGTLKQKLGQAIPWQTAFHVLLPVARGLAYAHQHDLIHRDVKPGNILIDENEEPILTDFGIAKLLEGTEGHTLTGSGVGIGTPEYMAPEQGIGASTIDARVDIYSLGIVLYEMIAGRKPYIADTPMAVVLKQMTDPLPRPTDFVPDLPESVEHILFKALAKQPEDRYADMNALIAAMESLLAGAQKAEAVAVPVPPKREKKKATPRAKPSNKVIKAVIGMLVAIAIIVLGTIVAPKIGGIFTNPAPTNTADPTVTSTVEPTGFPTTTPSATPTRTPRPTSTSTPPPAWVTDFAEPILSAIANYPPTIQDDLQENAGGWYTAPHNKPSQLQFVNGELILNGCYAYRSKMAYTDFVLELDTRFLQGTDADGQFGINYREFYNFWIRFDGSLSINSFHSQSLIHLPGKANTNHDSNQILIIAKGERYAFYVNEKPTYYLEDSHILKRQAIFFFAEPFPLFDESTYAKVALDNLKIWDLEKIPNLP